MQKLSHRITRSIEKLNSNQFDEYDIKNLLVDCRDLIKGNPLFKEIAHSIVHPIERDKGIFNSYVDYTYAKFKIISEFREKKDFNYGRIDKKLFELLFVNGLQYLPGKYVDTDSKLTKQRFKELISKSYIEKNGEYRINYVADYLDIHYGMSQIIGTLHIKSFIQPNDLIFQFENVVRKACEEINKPELYVKFSSQKKNDILVCIMSLMHSIKFKQFDGSHTSIYINIYDETHSLDLHKNGTLGIAAETNPIGFKHNSYIYPIFITNIKFKNYLDYIPDGKNNKSWFEVFKNVETIRNKEGELRLVNI